MARRCTRGAIVISKIGSIYVEVRGDTTKFKKSMTDLRSEAKKSSREISNALNNAVTPGTASAQLTKLGNSLQQLAQTAKVPEKQFKITADAIAKGLRKDAEAMGLTEKQFASLNEQMLKTQAWNTAEKAMKDVARASGMTSTELNDLAKQMGYTEVQALKLSGGMDKIQKEANELNRAFDKTEADAKQTAAAFDKVRIDALRMNAAFDKAAKTAKGKLAVAFEKAQHEAIKMNRAFDKARTGSTQMGRSFSSLKGKILGIAIAAGAAFYAIKQMSEAIWETGIATKVAENAYKEITGSVAKANQQFAFLSKTADDLGLNFFTLREGYKGFLAAAQSSKIPMQEVQAIFKSVSNAGAILGLSNERMKLSFLALEQMMSKGKVSMEEIRRQLGDNIPGAFQLGAKAMGLTVEAFDKAVSAGEVFADDFLPKFRKALEENYVGTIDDSVKASNKLAEGWERLKNEVADSGFIDDLTESMLSLGETLKDPQVLAGAKDLASILSSVLTIATGLTESDFVKGFLGGMLNKIKQITSAGEAFMDFWERMDKAFFPDKAPSIILGVISDTTEGFAKYKDSMVGYAAEIEEAMTQTWVTAQAILAEQKKKFAEFEKTQIALMKKTDSVRLSLLEKGLKEYANSEGARVDIIKSAEKEIDRIKRQMADREIRRSEKKLKALQAYNQEKYKFDIAAATLLPPDPFITKETDKARADEQADTDIERKTQSDSDSVTEFNELYKDLGKEKFDLERERIAEMAEVYKLAGAEQIEIARWVAEETGKISKAEQEAKLDLYRTAAGNVANTFKMISQAGGEQSKEAFMVYKAFAMVQAAIAGHQAVVGALGSPPYGIPAIINATAIGAMAAIQVGMIAASQPPSYDSGGVSNARGVYQTGSIKEAHIPIPSGKVKVDLGSEGGKESKEDRPREINIINNVDPDMLEQWAHSSRGQNAIINVIGARNEEVRRMVI